MTTTGSYQLRDIGGDPHTVYNSIDIYNPVTAGDLITLHAAGDIVQHISPFTTVPITTPIGLIRHQ